MKLLNLNLKDPTRIPGRSEARSFFTVPEHADELRVEGGWVHITKGDAVSLTPVANVKDATPLPAKK